MELNSIKMNIVNNSILPLKVLFKNCRYSVTYDFEVNDRSAIALDNDIYNVIFYYEKSSAEVKLKGGLRDIITNIPSPNDHGLQGKLLVLDCPDANVSVECSELIPVAF